MCFRRLRLGGKFPPEDALKISGQLPGCVEVHQVEDPGYFPHSYFRSIEFVILSHSPATLYICICQEKKILSFNVFLRHMSRARKEDTVRGKMYGGSQGARYAAIKTRKQGRYRKSTFPGTLLLAFYFWPTACI